MRNAETEWAVSHKRLAENSHKRYGMSGTLVCNRPSDMVGICVSVNATIVYQNPHHWSVDKNFGTINPITVKEFRRSIDRVTDEILNLPPFHEQTVSFEQTGFDNETASFYNGLLADAQELRVSVEAGGRASRDDLRRLMQKLGKMQQCLVSPLLARRGAEHFKTHTDCYLQAAKERSGALRALHAEIDKLRSEGHARIMVACCHVEPMRIARVYLQEVAHADVGDVFVYEGDLSLDQRQAQKNGFLTADKSILFLSIGAGGTGLHLVPGCNAAIFWGSRPYSPAQVHQAMKRIHRIGQEHAVFIRHVIAKGSVDAAIEYVHADKKALAGAIVDDDWGGMAVDGCSWKRSGRIVSACKPVGEGGWFVTQGPSAPNAPKPSKPQRDGIVKRPVSPGAVERKPAKMHRPSTGMNSAAAAAAAVPLAPANGGKQKVVIQRWKPIVATDTSAFFGKRPAPAEGPSRSYGQAGSSSSDAFRPATISFARPPSPGA